MKLGLSIKIVLFVLSSISSLTFANEKSINLAIDSSIPIVEHYKKRVFRAYVNLGYKVNFLETSMGRSILEVNNGRIDGITIVSSQVEKVNENLLRVPVLLASGQLVLVCHLDIPCSEKVLDDPLSVIGIVSGANHMSLYMKNKSASLYSSKNPALLTSMFEKKRLQYILSVEIDGIGNYSLLEKGKYSQITLVELKAYHFLHKRFSNFVPEITRSLNEVLSVLGPVNKESLTAN